jgi:hypothetical protein
MTDFNIRSDSVDVEQIMHHIRARIREKRGVDYTEQQIHEMAAARLERFLDPQGVRSDLLEQFHRGRATDDPATRNYAFEDTTLFESDKAWVRFARKLLKPVLKLFFNPNPLIQALHIQGQLNDVLIRRTDLYYEVIHNLVVEMTRLGIEVKNMRMRVESIGSRLDFAERRARALEGIVQYRAMTGAPVDLPSPPPAPLDDVATEGVATSDVQTAENGARRRRRRRRGRRGGSRGPASAAVMSSSDRSDSSSPDAGASEATDHTTAPSPISDEGPSSDQ